MNMKFFKGMKDKEKRKFLVENFNEDLTFEFEKAKYEYFGEEDTPITFYFSNKEKNITLKIYIDNIEEDVNIPKTISLKYAFSELFENLNWFSYIEIVKE